ncbi:uncharacterized protein KGF55_003005 [Candida pseudojiufengensis]|uniref:uncharacterized protein n=1 Tax=Candida pseudojiufengensis TaxID=497109 RepID=UPI002225692B|nr:uncharacterized protein KGF55_003005 [Candida pseudojiufengensis]KAI5963213.1 hypothetical protein KGF55_003005 [Candida pseudojiufengensis]
MLNENIQDLVEEYKSTRREYPCYMRTNDDRMIIKYYKGNVYNKMDLLRLEMCGNYYRIITEGNDDICKDTDDNGEKNPLVLYYPNTQKYVYLSDEYRKCIGFKDQKFIKKMHSFDALIENVMIIPESDNKWDNNEYIIEEYFKYLKRSEEKAKFRLSELQKLKMLNEKYCKK